MINTWINTTAIRLHYLKLVLNIMIDQARNGLHAEKVLLLVISIRAVSIDFYS